MRTLAFVIALWLTACATDAPRSLPTAAGPSKPNISRERLKLLRDQEGALRSRFEPAEQRPWLDVSGSDPYRIVARSGEAGGYVGVLRGGKALVTLDAELVELGRSALPEAPTTLCLTTPDQALAASRYSSALWRVELNPSPRLVESKRIEASGVLDLACGHAGISYALTEESLLTLDAGGHVLQRREAMRGGLRLLVRGRYLLENSLFERSLRVLALDRRGVPGPELGRIQHDGPLWAFDALVQADQLLVAVTGVEDRPLVRAHGEFENIDSYLWLYRLRFASEGPAIAGLERLTELNVSEQGLVVPKALALHETASGAKVSLLAAGSGRLLRARWPDPKTAPVLETDLAVPGASDAVFGADGQVRYASPLFDAWIHLDRYGSRLVRVEPDKRPEWAQRLGEALFFTELIAPENDSSGGHSRFSCETCHFEGGVDGRTHYTGRADVSVVTKPLFGLANNRPHFSRALDRDLSSVCHNEFRVAGAGSGSDPWFTLAAARFPWLHELGINAGELSPLELRAALLQFLYAFSHAPNPRAQKRHAFSELEQQGALAFAQHCASCHAPRLVSDEPASAVAQEDWSQYVFSRQAPIVWARAEYAKTGVLPYVHEPGTRIPSLRRLALKPRYFTNGSSATLASVLQRFREAPSGALHAASEEERLPPLPDATQRALLAFLQLL
jgi:hypothetical protein